MEKPIALSHTQIQGGRLLTGGDPQGTEISEFEEQALQTVGIISVDGLKGLPHIGLQEISTIEAPEHTLATEFVEVYDSDVEEIDDTPLSILQSLPLQLPKPFLPQKKLPPTPKTLTPPA